MGNTLYIVVPCYNEQECIVSTANQLKNVMLSLRESKKISDESRILFVNDGSRDKTLELIEELNREDGIFTGISLSRNKGHQVAVMAGISYASGYADAVITIDADLQDDIAVIETMVDRFAEGNDIVYGVRTDRKSDTAFKRGTAGAYYKLLAKMGVEIVDNHADFRLMSKRSCEALLEYKETNLFLRGIVPQLGFKSCTVGYERKERTAGVSKYPLKKMLELALDGITSFSVKPLKLITFSGILTAAISLAVMLVFSVLFICGVLSASYGFYILLSVWLSLGINLIMLGIIGDYIGRTYKEVKHRPLFFIDREIK